MKTCHLTLFSFFVFSPWSFSQNAPELDSLFLQKVGETTYFELSLSPLGKYSLPKNIPGKWWTSPARTLRRLPRLVPQDAKTEMVYFLAQEGVFVGKIREETKSQFLLMVQLPGHWEKEITPEEFLKGGPWKESTVEVDFSKGKRYSPVSPPFPSPRHDLEFLWAKAQGEHFAILETLVPDFGFFGFVRLANNRRYQVQVDPLNPISRPAIEPKNSYQKAFDITSGVFAITEALQLNRMKGGKMAPQGERVIPIQEIPAIQSPWKKREGKSGETEALSKFIPHDNYYFHFKTFKKMVDFDDFLDQWGAPLLRFFELKGRDYQIKRQYEKQICIRFDTLGKTFGPLVIRSSGITGHDHYLREGTDLAFFFQTTNTPLFLLAVEPFIQEARKEFGKELEEIKREYQGVKINIFRTPHREISLYRAVIDSLVIYANSQLGLERIIDTSLGKRPSLADDLDFQQMRARFPLSDSNEEGFGFFSRAFIQQMLSPAVRIKQKRRVDAATSLMMVNNASLFYAWDQGEFPKNMDALKNHCKLRPEEIEVPEGKSIRWDEARRAAYSSAYNTLNFLTPLIELPVDKVTADEAKEYGVFRKEYNREWGTLLGPIALRSRLNPQQVRIETVILPLPKNPTLDELREWAGGKTFKVENNQIFHGSLFQWFFVPKDTGKGIGEWMTFNLGDSPLFERIMDVWMRQQVGLPVGEDLVAYGRLILQLPGVAGVHMSGEKEFGALLKRWTNLADFFLGDFEEKKTVYKNTPILQMAFTPKSLAAELLNDDKIPKKDWFLPSLYHAKIRGAWYVSFWEDPIHDLIDQAQNPEKLKEKNGVEVNNLFYAAPGKMKHFRQAFGKYQDWQTHLQAIENNALWHLLYRTSLVSPKANEKDKRQKALHHLGFIPVSPDGLPYQFIPAKDEVENLGHGSLRSPQWNREKIPQKPLPKFLDEFQVFFADLRIETDSLYSTLTIDRKKK